MKKIAAALSLLVAMGGAFAQTYVGGTLGESHLDIDCTGTTKCDNTDTGYKLYVGHKLSRSLAAEVSYLSFGKAKLTAGGVDVSIETHALVAALALIGEISPELTATVRVGVADIDSRATAWGIGGSTEGHANGYVGLGMSYSFAKNWWVTVNADFSEMEYGGSSGTIRLLSLGTQYNF